MTTALEVERQHIVLADETVVVFDYKNGTYRVVLYRRRRPGENDRQVDSATFDYLVAQRILPHSYRTGWARFATFHTQLSMALAHVIENAQVKHDAYEVDRYIRAMPYGKDLP